MAKTLEERYWAYVDVRGPDDCWPWIGVTHKGYGRFYDGISMRGAHRVAWKIAHGDPGDLHVLHSCDNPPCQNPAHLRLGTHAENMREREERGRGKYVRGSRHGKSKLTEQQVREIRDAYTGKYGEQTAIAKRYGITQANVSNIILGRTWQHLG